MLERLVEFVLASKLHSILLNFDRHSFSIWLWQGRVVMHDLQLNPKLCSGLGLPLELRYGHIDTVDLAVPWRALATEAVEVRVEGVVLVLGTLGKEEWRVDREEMLAELREKVDFEDGRLRIKEGETSSGSLTEKIIRNLQFEVRNVHIRLESEDCQCSLGLVSELISSPAPLSSGTAGFTKAISVGVVYLYAESTDITQRTGEIAQGMEELTCRFLCGEESGSVICPLSLEAELSHQSDTSQSTIKLTIPRLDLHLSQTQFQCISRLMQVFGEFSAFQTDEKLQLFSQFQAYLESNPSPISHKQTFKSARTRLKPGQLLPTSAAQYRYDAIIATTPEEELFAWLLELNGETVQPSRLAWISSWFTGNRPVNSLTPPISSEFDTSTLEIEVNITRVKVTLQGRRTTCSDYIYRLEVDIEGLGGLCVQQCQHRRLALHLSSFETRFQDPISLHRLSLFQFLSATSADEQVFLTINQHLSIRPNTTIALQLEPFRFLISMSILTQLQTFFSTASSSPPSQPQLWQSLDLDVHLKPWELVLLADETKPCLHLVMNVGDTAVVKVAQVEREEEGLKVTNERVTICVNSWDLVLVNPSLAPVPLFSLSQRIHIELKADQNDFASLELLAHLPDTQIHLSKSTLQLLKSFFSLFLAPSSSESPYIDTRKKTILSSLHSDKHFGMVWRHYQLSWRSYFTVLAKGYLYFFTSPEEKEANMYFAVANCEVRDPVTERLLQEQDCFEPFEETPLYQVIVVGRNGERSCRLGFETAEMCKEWVAYLSPSAPSTPPLQSSPSLPNLHLRFTLPRFHLSLELEPSKPLSITLNDAQIAAELIGTQCELSFQGRVGMCAGKGEAPRRFRELILPISPIQLKVVYNISENPGLNVILESEKIELNWNHETISSLIKAVSTSESPTSSQNKPPPLPLSLHIALKSLLLTLNNEPTLFTFSEIHLKDLSLYMNSAETEVKLSSISIFDVSNYPEAAILTENNPPRRVPLLKTKGKSPISISILKNNLKATLSHIEIVYMQQPFLRVVHTLLYHIPSVLSA